MQAPELEDTPDDASTSAAPPLTHTRRHTEVMQQKIADEFKVKHQQVHQDISHTRQETFKEIANSRTLPASEAFGIIQGQFKGAVTEFEEAQKLRRQQQFEEVAGIRRQRANSLPFIVPPVLDNQSKSEHENVKKEIKSSGRKSVREIASAFQGSSLPQTMETFLQNYVQQQSVHRRNGSNNWRTPIKKSQDGGSDSSCSVDVIAASAEIEAMTEHQKDEMMARFVDIRRMHGLETPSQELDRLRQALKMDIPPTTNSESHTGERVHNEAEASNQKTTMWGEPSTPSPPKPPTSFLGNDQETPIPDQPNGNDSMPTMRSPDKISTLQESNNESFTPALNLKCTEPSQIPRMEVSNELPRTPSNSPIIAHRQSPAQNTAESSSGEFHDNLVQQQLQSQRYVNTPTVSQRTLSIYSAGTNQAVIGENNEHHDHESQVSASVDTLQAVRHTDASTMSRSGSLDEHTSVATTTAGVVVGGTESCDGESTNVGAVLVPQVAVQNTVAQRPSQQEGTPKKEQSGFWCCW